MENELLRKAQLKMLTALIELDSICSRYNINYWIDAGTLLGAVRHKGFIPWDDDIDVCMIREDFDKFVQVCSKELNKEHFFLQTDKTDKHYCTYNIPCKLRINNSEIIEKDELKYGYYNQKSHHGLFIDIFPYDKYSKNSFIRSKIERFISKVYLLKVTSQFKKIKFTKKIIIKLIFFFLPKVVLTKLKNIQIHLMNKRKNNFVYSAGIETPFYRATFNENEIFPLNKIMFEGYYFNCPNKTDLYLKKMFNNDYMSIPEQKNRKSHYHSIKLEI